MTWCWTWLYDFMYQTHPEVDAPGPIWYPTSRWQGGQSSQERWMFFQFKTFFFFRVVDMGIVRFWIFWFCTCFFQCLSFCCFFLCRWHVQDSASARYIYTRHWDEVSVFVGQIVLHVGSMNEHLGGCFTCFWEEFAHPNFLLLKRCLFVGDRPFWKWLVQPQCWRFDKSYQSW